MEPDTEPMPPTTTTSRIWYVMLVVKDTEDTDVLHMASMAPATPQKKELTTKEIILCRARLMPMASAAISSSRMALNARP